MSISPLSTIYSETDSLPHSLPTSPLVPDPLNETTYEIEFFPPAENPPPNREEHSPSPDPNVSYTVPRRNDRSRAPSRESIDIDSSVEEIVNARHSVTTAVALPILLQPNQQRPLPGQTDPSTAIETNQEP